MESINSDYNFRFQSEIQGLRGIAVILVVLYHAGLLFSGGFIGVDVFFVISGYVITGSILHQAAQKKFTWAGFVERRVRRLLPSLSAMIVLTLLMGVLLNPISTMEFARRTGVAAILVNANHYLLRQGGYFDGAAELNPFLHTWSLSVEEQFYIVFPIVVILSVGAAFKLKRLRWVLWVLVALSAGLSLFLSYTPEIFGQSGPKLAFFLAATRSWEFGIGALLALAPKKLYSPSLAWIGLAGVIGSAAFIGPEHVFPGIVVFIPVIATALLIAGGRSQDTLISKSLSHPYLVRIGDVSYGWYLWHWPFMIFAKGLVPSISNYLLGAIGVFTLGLAFLNERWIENPFRHSTKLKRLDWRVIAVFSLIAPLPLFGVIQVVDVSPAFPSYDKAIKAKIEYDEIGCDEYGPYEPDKCTWGNGETSVLIVGDSNARQHIPAFREIDGYKFIARTRSNCPLSKILLRERVPQAGCTIWTEEIHRYINSERPDMIIASIAFDHYLNNSDFSLEGDKSLNMRAQLKSDLDKLRIHGVPVFFIQEIEKFKRNGVYINVRDCSVLGLELDQELSRCNAWTEKVIPLSFNEEGYVILPTLAELSNETLQLYIDGGHLNADGSRLFVQFWTQFLSNNTKRD